MLLRIPMLCELDDVARWCDYSLESERATLGIRSSIYGPGTPAWRQRMILSLIHIWSRAPEILRYDSMSFPENQQKIVNNAAPPLQPVKKASQSSRPAGRE